MEDGLDYRIEYGRADESDRVTIPALSLDINVPEGAMTLGQVQERLGVTHSAVSKLISRGRLGAVSYDGRKYVTREALDEYMPVEHKRGRRAGYSPGGSPDVIRID